MTVYDWSLHVLVKWKAPDAINARGRLSRWLGLGESDGGGLADFVPMSNPLFWNVLKYMYSYKLKLKLTSRTTMVLKHR